MMETEVTDFQSAYAYLMQDGNLAVPCSRYGDNTEECAVIALAYMLYAVEDSAEWTVDYVESVMGSVVNDSDDLVSFAGRGCTNGMYVQSAVDRIDAIKRDTYVQQGFAAQDRPLTIPRKWTNHGGTDHLTTI